MYIWAPQFSVVRAPPVATLVSSFHFITSLLWAPPVATQFSVLSQTFLKVQAPPVATKKFVKHCTVYFGFSGAPRGSQGAPRYSQGAPKGSLGWGGGSQGLQGALINGNYSFYFLLSYFFLNIS